MSASFVLKRHVIEMERRRKCWERRKHTRGKKWTHNDTGAECEETGIEYQLIVFESFGGVTWEAERVLQSGPQAELGRGDGPTYFEITTALAFLHFADRQADAAVVEVGLGGRLDSTNVIEPVVAVISSVSLDHTKQLGSTLTDIAREKAGIFKRGVSVVSGVTEAEPRRVIRQTAQRLGCRLLEASVDFSFRYAPPARLDVPQPSGTIDFECRATGMEHRYSGLELSLLGHH